MTEKILIQDFIKNICEKQYASANVDLEKIVNEKLRKRIVGSMNTSAQVIKPRNSDLEESN